MLILMLEYMSQMHRRILVFVAVEYLLIVLFRLTNHYWLLLCGAIK